MRIINNSIKIIGDDLGGHKAISNQFIPKNTIIGKFYSMNNSSKFPNRHTVSYNNQQHLDIGTPNKFFSHNCGKTSDKYGPNLVVKMRKKLINTNTLTNSFQKPMNCQINGVFITKKNIESYEDLTFNYNTTELNISHPFLCNCIKCQKDMKSRYINGYIYLDYKEQKRILNECSENIKNFYNMMYHF